MNEELNNSEHQITVDKPEKDPRRIKAGKKLAAFNKMVRKRKESGDELKEPEHHEDRENNSEGEMSNTTKILLLTGVAGLGYYLYTKPENNDKEEVKKNVQPTAQNYNNEVQENTVSRLRTFKN